MIFFASTEDVAARAGSILDLILEILFGQFCPLGTYQELVAIFCTPGIN